MDGEKGEINGDEGEINGGVTLMTIKENLSNQ